MDLVNWVKRRRSAPSVEKTTRTNYKRKFLVKPWLTKELSEKEIKVLGKVLAVRGGYNYNHACRKLLPNKNMYSTQAKLYIGQLAMRFIYQYVMGDEKK